MYESDILGKISANEKQMEWEFVFLGSNTKLKRYECYISVWIVTW